jgi:hypothetical protein
MSEQQGVSIEDLNRILSPARRAEETVEEYKIRRTQAAAMVKNHMNGVVIYDSSNRKPYRKPEQE